MTPSSASFCMEFLSSLPLRSAPAPASPAMAAHDSSEQPQPQPSPPSTQKMVLDSPIEASRKYFPFFELPGELRNYIYELVLYHEDGHGCITPPPDPYTTVRGRMISVNGVRTAEFDPSGRLVGFHGDYRTLECKARSGSASASESALWDIIQAHKSRWDAYAVGGVHLCTWRCLLQPPLTRVSRQFREESLPVFYGVNEIHLELAHFAVSDPSRMSVIRLRNISSTGIASNSPVHQLTKWWRAIGDTNLRSIARMTLVIGIKGAPREVALIVTCDHGRFTITNGAQEAVDALSRTRSVVRNDDHTTYNLNLMPNLFQKEETFSPTIRRIDMDTLTSRVDSLQDNGLHVRGLECLLHDASALSGTHYLPDRISLDENWDGHLSQGEESKKEEKTIKALSHTLQGLRTTDWY